MRIADLSVDEHEGLKRDSSCQVVPVQRELLIEPYIVSRRAMVYKKYENAKEMHTFPACEATQHVAELLFFSTPYA